MFIPSSDMFCIIFLMSFISFSAAFKSLYGESPLKRLPSRYTSTLFLFLNLHEDKVYLLVEQTKYQIFLVQNLNLVI